MCTSQSFKRGKYYTALPRVIHTLLTVVKYVVKYSNTTVTVTFHRHQFKYNVAIVYKCK